MTQTIEEVERLIRKNDELGVRYSKKAEKLQEKILKIEHLLDRANSGYDRAVKKWEKIKGKEFNYEEFSGGAANEIPIDKK